MSDFYRNYSYLRGHKMVEFDFNIDKAVHAALYIVSKIGPTKYHKIFKILYFAEKGHLLTYGRPITGDRYISMNYGPVPSYIYDIFKAVETRNHPFVKAEPYLPFFKISDRIVSAVSAPDLEELSESDLKALDKSIEENRDLSFALLTEKSHDKAWEEAFNGKSEMDYLSIAQAGGADEKMISYIRSTTQKLV